MCDSRGKVGEVIWTCRGIVGRQDKGYSVWSCQMGGKGEDHRQDSWLK